MKIQYYTKDRIALSLSNLNPYLSQRVGIEVLYDQGEDCEGKPLVLLSYLKELLPSMRVRLDRSHNTPGNKYYRFTLTDQLGNCDYLKFIYE